MQIVFSKKIEPSVILVFIYILFSFYYTKERMLNTDNSFQLFNIINNRAFFFQEARYGVFLTQLPLLVCTYFHFPIQILVLIYSISFSIFYAGILWVNLRVFECKEAALATILSLLVGVAYTFFHTITETHQILALSCLLYGLLSSRHKVLSGFFFYFLFFIILFWNLMTHPVSVFTVLFVIGLTFFQKKLSFKEVFAGVLICILIMGVKFFFTPHGSYDDKQYSNLLDFKSKIVGFFSLYPYKYLISKVSTTYLSSLSIIFISLFFFNGFKEKLFTSICFLIFMFVSILTFSNGDCDAMMEKSFLPGIFMFVMLFSISYYQYNQSVFFYVVIFIIAVLGFKNIYKAGKDYTSRLDLLTSIIYKMDDSTPKLIVSYSDFDEKVSKFNNWATSLDVLFLSKMETGRAKTVFMVEDKYEYNEVTQEKDLFLYLPWDSRKIKHLNQHYFNLPKIPYKIYQSQ